MSAETLTVPFDGRCPGCRALLAGGGRQGCPRCGLRLTGPAGAELCWLTAELARIDHYRGTLAARRSFLVGELRRAAQQQDASAAGLGQVPAARGGPGSGGSLTPALAGAGSPPAIRRELSALSAARLLLAAGGLLVVIAAAAFAAANWGTMGPGPRALILLALAAAVLASPWPLARRQLRATAEVIAAIGLAITVADAYLAGALTGSAAAGPGFFAAVTALLVAGWAGYGAVAPVRGPRLAAIALGQVPLPLAAAALARPGETAVLSVAVLATAGADLAIARLAGRAGRGRWLAERRTALAAAGVSWLAGIALACTGAVTGTTSGAAVATASCAFAAAAAIGLGLAAELTSTRRAGVPATHRGGARPSGAAAEAGGAGMTDTAARAGRLAEVLSGALVAAAIAEPVIAAVTDGVAPSVLALAAAVVIAAGRFISARAATARTAGATATAHRFRHLAAGGLTVACAAAAWVAPAAIAGTVAPFALVTRAWSGHVLRFPLLPGGPGISLNAPAVLCVLAAASWLWPAGVPRTGQRGRPRRAAGSGTFARCAGIATAALAGGCLPAAARLPVGAGLAVLTGLVVLLAIAGCVLADRREAGTASVAAVVLAGVALAASLAASGLTVAELAALTVVFSLAAWRNAAEAGSQPRQRANAWVLAEATGAAGVPIVADTAAAVAAAAGLACAAPLAAGSLAAGQARAVAAFCVLAVATASVALAIMIWRTRPLHALVLQVMAVPVTLLAGLLVAHQGGTFSLLASAAAMAAAVAAMFAGRRQRLALLVFAALAATAALAPLAGVLAAAATARYRELVGYAGPLATGHAGGHAWPLAMIVLATCAAAAVAGAWAWSGRRGAGTAVAVVLPVVAAPAASAAGLGEAAAIAMLLGLAIALTAWATLSDSLAPAGAALVAAWLVVPWALPSRPATLAVTGCLGATYCASAWSASRRARACLGGTASLRRACVVAAGAAAAAVITIAGFCVTAALGAGLAGWQAGLVLVGFAGAGEFAAWRLSGADAQSGEPADGTGDDLASAGQADAGTGAGTAIAVEVAGWFAALAGLLACLDTARHASAALAAAAALVLAASCRADRRPLSWIGLALAEAAWALWLLTVGVAAPEPYLAPAGCLLLLSGWRRARRSPAAGSWPCYGPGLALLLLPSLAAAMVDTGWVRPLLLGLAATATTLVGGRAGLRAPLLLGAAVAVADAGRQLGPAAVHVVSLVPRWAPVALLGTVLLVAGATYEARLANLRTLRDMLRRMR
jgi:hypothetical protein